MDIAFPGISAGGISTAGSLAGVRRGRSGTVVVAKPATAKATAGLRDAALGRHGYKDSGNGAWRQPRNPENTSFTRHAPLAQDIGGAS